MNNKNYMITFSKNLEDSDMQYLGFKFFEKDEAQNFLKCVKKLAEENVQFDAGDGIQIYYALEDFEKMKISQAQSSFLAKIFECDEDFEKAGFFPNAIDDAYDYGLMDEEDEEDEEDEDYC